MKPEPPNVDPHAQIRLRLLDLAQDASLYLRRSADPSVRVAAALLLSASLAGCVVPPSVFIPRPSSAPEPAVPPLTQEVKQGLPASPGDYPVSSNSLTRDAQGVYGFSWRNPTGAATWNQGRASLMKLAQGTDDTLEVPQSGDPILRLKPDTPITLPNDENPVGPTPGTSNASTSSSSSSSSGNRSIAWYPFLAGGGTTTASTSPSSTDTVAATTPAFRNPPAAEPGQGSVRGASSSLSAPTSSARTWTSPARAAATGQAGGPGGGTAATSRAGVAQGASRPGSSSFSGGKSGSSSSSSSSSSSGG